jgi:hypothetical protein
VRRVEATPELVGRDWERARVEEFVAGVPSGARALLVTGEPGIGKTALWRHGIRACERAGFGVRVTRAAEEEMQLGLAGIVDLFGDEPGVTADNLFARGQATLAALRRPVPARAGHARRAAAAGGRGSGPPRGRRSAVARQRLGSGAAVRAAAAGRRADRAARDLTADFHGKGDFGQDLAVDAEGRIVAAGFAGSSTGTEFALLRALP